MTGVYLVVAAEAGEPLEGGTHVLCVAAEVDAPDAASKEGIACEQRIADLIAHAAGGVSGRVDDCDLQLANVQRVVVAERLVFRYRDKRLVCELVC